MKGRNYEVVGQIVNMSFVVDGTKTATSIVGKFYTSNANKINVIKINYIAIEPIFEVYTFTYHWMDPNQQYTKGHFYS